MVVHLDENVVRLTSESYNKCLCDSTISCVTRTGFFYAQTPIPLFIIPGLLKGCFTIESLLWSDLRCFYNQTCIDTVKSFYPMSWTMNMTYLDPSLLIKFAENSTTQEMLDQLMVNQWNLSIMYNNYYDQCQPSQCTYSYTMRNSVIYIAIAIIGLVGGLVTAFKFAVPRVVEFIVFCLRKREMKVNAVMPAIEA